MSTGNTSEVQAFYSFLEQRLNAGGVLGTPEQLLKDWRANREYQETVDDVRQGVADYEAGKGVSAEVAFSNVRNN
ncbi:MAG: hypothetical protein MI725_10515 [Pirellulales bacterium]|nr:hypothetical protein [Pirellulales bacterium]